MVFRHTRQVKLSQQIEYFCIVRRFFRGIEKPIFDNHSTHKRLLPNLREWLWE